MSTHIFHPLYYVALIQKVSKNETSTRWLPGHIAILRLSSPEEANWKPIVALLVLVRFLVEHFHGHGSFGVVQFAAGPTHRHGDRPFHR